MKKLFLLIFLLIFAKSVFAASINGYVLNANNNQPIENIIVYAQRTDPNPWENLILTDVSDSEGSFSVQDLPIGTYRIYTNWNDEYFSIYYEIFIEVTDVNDQIHYIDLLMQPVLSQRGKISGFVNSESLDLENSFLGVQIKQKSGPGEYEISHGFIEVDEHGYFEKDDLNIGYFKVGLFFYGEFNGMIWYENSLDEENATIIEITPENPLVENIDFDIGYNSLNTSYVVVENVIVNTGYDNQLDFSEEFEFSLELKNLSNHDAIDSSVYLWSNLGYLNFEFVHLDSFDLAGNESVIVGPFQASIEADVPDQEELQIFYTYVLDNNLGMVRDNILFTANAPVIEITETSIEALPEENMYVAHIHMRNRGNASIPYPTLTILTDNSAVEFFDEPTESYYVFPHDGGMLDFYYEFHYDGMNPEIDFMMNISSLSGTFQNDLFFQLTIQNPTENDLSEIQNITLKNYPNPFSISQTRNSGTKISFDLIADNFTNIEIFNVKGQKIKTLVNQELRKGEHSFLWNGKDDSNNLVSAGVYFYKMKSGRYTKTKKILLLK